jgi:hypothetical protein
MEMLSMKHLLFPIATIFLLGLSNNVGFSQTGSQRWSVDPFDGAMKIVGVDESSGSTTFILKNTSGKVVTAYSACFNITGSHTACNDADWFTNEVSPGLKPGGTDRLTKTSKEIVQYRDKVLEISVLFEDGTSSGSKVEVARLEINRLGRTLETKRVLVVAESYKDKDLNDIDLEKLVGEIGSLPNRPDRQFMTDVMLMKQSILPELTIPDPPNGPPIVALSLLSGVSSVRSNMLRAVNDIRKLPVKSEITGAITRRIYLSALMEKLKTESTQQINICKKSQGLRY